MLPRPKRFVLHENIAETLGAGLQTPPRLEANRRIAQCRLQPVVMWRIALQRIHFAAFHFI